MNSKFTNLINLVVFQVAWFCCVLAPLSPFPKTLPFLGLTLCLVRSVYSEGLFLLLPFMVGSLLMGLVGDACLVHFGFLTFTEYPTLLGVPYWMLILWLNFGLMLRPLFIWFLNQRWRCLIGFSIGGALAYFSGQKLGVLTFPQGWTSAFAVACEWTLAGFLMRYLHLTFSNKPD